MSEKIAYATQSVRIRITQYAAIHGPMETQLKENNVKQLPKKSKNPHLTNRGGKKWTESGWRKYDNQQREKRDKEK